MSPWHGNRFNGLAHLEDQEDGCTAVLLRPLVYTTVDGWRIEVEAGVRSDFASVPRLLWVIIPPRGPYNRGAFIHDKLYQVAPVDPTTGRRCTRLRADQILREACENCDDRVTRRWAIYLGVRLGGWIVWRKYRRAERARLEAT